MHDLLIAGAGPSGLAAAIEAASRGLDVVVADPQPGVIDKACGEGLMPSAIAVLRELGVQIPVHHDFVGIRYVHGDQAAEGRFHDGPGWGVRRTVLHQAMLDRAHALGVRIVTRRIVDPISRDHHVEANDLRARWLIAADGLRSPIRRQLGLDLPSTRPRRYGLRQHHRTVPWTDHVEVHWAADAEAYVTPVGAELIGVAFLFDDRLREGDGTPLQRLSSRFPALMARLGPPASHLRGAGPFAHEAARRVHGRILLIGDAAGYLDPITGEGIKLGLLGARAAVQALVDDHPTRWEHEWRRLYRPYALATGGLLWVTGRPRLRSWLVPTLRAAPGIMTAALRIIGG